MASTSASALSSIPVHLAQLLPYPQTPYLVSPSLFQRLQNTATNPNMNYKKCKVLPIDPEYDFINKYFFANQPTNQTIKNVHCVHNPAATNQFQSHLYNIETDGKNPFFAPKWTTESHSHLRQQALDRWKQTVAPYSPLKIHSGNREDSLVNAKVLPLWHGSDAGKCDSIFNSNFTFFGKHAYLKGGAKSGPNTDIGYFGSGIYFTNSARYAANIYANGHLILAFVSMREPYPVVADCTHPNKPQDMKKLEGLGAYQNYNAHYIPVAPIYPNPYCGTYYPCASNQIPECDEIAVFNNSQTLARFWVELEPEMTKQIPANASTLLLKNVMELLDEQVIKGDTRLLQFFQDKQQVLVAIGATGTLSLEEQGFFHWVAEFFDQTGKVNGVAVQQFASEAFPKLTYASPLTAFAGGIQLSAPHPDFIGRKDLLETLEKTLLPDNWKPKDPTLVKVLIGPGGRGKTETAITFGNTHINSFSLVWLIRAETDALFEKDYRALAELLKIYHEKTSLSDLIKEIHIKLENHIFQKPYLLILDNIENNATIPQRGGVVLMTTRDREIWPHHSAFLEVPPFSLEEAILFIHQADPQATKQDIALLVQTLEGFPLLLGQAVHYMVANHVSLLEYLQIIQQDHPLWKKDSYNSYPNSLAMAYSPTLKKLEQNNPTAFQILQLCAYLNPDAIIPSLFEIFDKKGKTPETASSSIRLKTLLHILEAQSLLRYDPNEKLYTIHRNLQYILQNNHTLQKEELKNVNQTATLLKDRLERFDEADPLTWKVAEECFAHIEFLFKHPLWNDVSPETQAELLRITGEWLRLVRNEQVQTLPFQNMDDDLITHPVKSLGLAEHRLNLALKFQETAYAIIKKHHENKNNTRELAFSLHSLGNIWFALEDYSKGKEYHEAALNMRKQLYGDKPHAQIAQSLNSLGNVWLMLKDYSKAKEYHEAALNIRTQLYGDKLHAQIAESLSNLGIVWRFLEDYSKAKECMEVALNMRKQLYGDKPHAQIAQSLNNLGLVWGKFRVYSNEEIEYHEAALNMRKQLYEDKPQAETAQSLYYLGMAWGQRNNHFKAKEYYEAALNMRKQLYGDKPHAETAQYLNNLGKEWVKLKDYSKAKEYYEAALNMRKQLYGDKPHTQIAQSLNYLGKECVNLKDYSKAKEYYEAALNTRKQIYEDKPHARIVSSLYSLGNVWHLLEDYSKAKDYAEAALNMRKQLYGDKPHALIADSLTILGMSLFFCDDYSEANKYMEDALKMLTQLYGDKPRNEIIRCLSTQGSIHTCSKKYSKAKECYENAYKMSVALLGENHITTKKIKNSLKMAESDQKCTIL